MSLSTTGDDLEHLSEVVFVTLLYCKESCFLIFIFMLFSLEGNYHVYSTCEK